MSGSGMLYGDAALISLLGYLFWGGWIVTLAGEVLAVMVMLRFRRLFPGLALALGCLAPLAYALFWAVLHQLAPREPAITDPLALAVVAGLAVCVFAAPLAALVRLVRGPDARSPRPDRSGRGARHQA